MSVKPELAEVELYDARCPHCGKLMAKVNAEGVHLVRERGVVIAQVAEGWIICRRCRAELHVKITVPKQPTLN